MGVPRTAEPAVHPRFHRSKRLTAHAALAGCGKLRNNWTMHTAKGAARALTRRVSCIRTSRLTTRDVAREKGQGAP